VAIAERQLPAISPFVGALLVLGAAVVFSFGGLAFRLTNDIGAWQYVVFRGLGAFLVTVTILVFRYRSRGRELAAQTQLSHLGAGVLLGMISSIFIVALDAASVAFVMFLQALAPISSAYFSWLFLRERVSGAVLIATAASLVGVAIMFSATLTDRIDPVGTIAIAIPVLFGLYATTIRGTREIEPQVPVVVAGLTLVVFGLVGSALTGGLEVSASDALIGLFAGGALLSVPVAFLNVAARVVPAPEVALLLMAEVILAPVWVWIFVNESPAITTAVGGAVNLAAVLGLLLWRRARTQPSTPPTVQL